jgi:hypothetical protein
VGAGDGFRVGDLVGAGVGRGVGCAVEIDGSRVGIAVVSVSEKVGGATLGAEGAGTLMKVGVKPREKCKKPQTIHNPEHYLALDVPPCA